MKLFDVRVSIELEPVGFADIVVTCNSFRKELLISNPITLNFNYSASQSDDQIIVEHRNRPAHDGVTSVIVKSVTLNDITNEKITYQGIYYPNNFEPKRSTYIDHNGRWVLDFSVPVYTWLHQTLGMGWIYD